MWKYVPPLTLTVTLTLTLTLTAHLEAPWMDDPQLSNRELKVVVAPTKSTDPTRSTMFTFTFEAKEPEVTKLSPPRGLISGGLEVGLTIINVPFVSDISMFLSDVQVQFGPTTAAYVHSECSVNADGTTVNLVVLSPEAQTAGEVDIGIMTIFSDDPIPTGKKFTYQGLPDGVAPISMLQPKEVTLRGDELLPAVTVKMSNFRVVEGRDELYIVVGGTVVAGENITKATPC